MPSPVSLPSRRQLVAATLLGLFAARPARAAGDAQGFIAEAFRMRDQAVAAGDQPYGAVMVLDGSIIGFGESRVIREASQEAHAERVALWAAQRRLGRSRLTGAVIYASSVPCLACQRALAAADVSRMIHGREATDAGPPVAR